MNINNRIINKSNMVSLGIKRSNKIIGYLWISLFFILKEGYRQMYKKWGEKKYNVKVRLKYINNIFPIKENVFINYSKWKNNYLCIESINFRNFIINNNNEFINLSNKYIKKNEEIMIINIKFLLINNLTLESL